MPSVDRSLTESAPGADGYRHDHPSAAHVAIVDAEAGILGIQRKRFALCGFAETSRKHMPIDDERWLMIGMNQLYRHLPRWDVLFDVHWDWRECLEETDHAGWLASCGIPIIMLQCESSVPTSVRFPIERVLAYGLDYLTSTTAYMLAWTIDHIDRAVMHAASQRMADGLTLEAAQRAVHALYGEYTVGLFGIDLVAGGEFELQRPCAEFWIGRLAARGVGIIVPPESALLKQLQRYGQEPSGEFGQLRLGDFDRRGIELDGQITSTLAQVERLAGRREEQLYWRQMFELRQRGSTVRPGKGV